MLQKLDEKQNEAIVRAKNLSLRNNPSSNVHLFITELERISKT
jgi:hypothetical protein